MTEADYADPFANETETPVRGGLPKVELTPQQKEYVLRLINSGHHAAASVYMSAVGKKADPGPKAMTAYQEYQANDNNYKNQRQADKDAADRRDAVLKSLNATASQKIPKDGEEQELAARRERQRAAALALSSLDTPQGRAHLANSLKAGDTPEALVSRYLQFGEHTAKLHDENQTTLGSGNASVRDPAGSIAMAEAATRTSRRLGMAPDEFIANATEYGNPLSSTKRGDIKNPGDSYAEVARYAASRAADTQDQYTRDIMQNGYINGQGVSTIADVINSTYQDGGTYGEKAAKFMDAAPTMASMVHGLEPPAHLRSAPPATVPTTVHTTGRTNFGVDSGMDIRGPSQRGQLNRDGTRPVRRDAEGREMILEALPPAAVPTHPSQEAVFREAAGLAAKREAEKSVLAGIATPLERLAGPILSKEPTALESVRGVVEDIRALAESGKGLTEEQRVMAQQVLAKVDPAMVAAYNNNMATQDVNDFGDYAQTAWAGRRLQNTGLSPR
jgi:hypothetical protein